MDGANTLEKGWLMAAIRRRSRVNVTGDPVYSISLQDNGADQSSSLIGQIAAIPDGTPDHPSRILLPCGSFRIDQRILVSARSWLNFDGLGCFTHYSDLDGIELGIVDGGGNSTRAHWFFTNSDDCSFKNVIIRGPNFDLDPVDPEFSRYFSNREIEHGVAIQGASQRITLDNLNISHVHGDTVYVGGTGPQNQSITVRNVLGRYMGRQGMGIVNVNGLLVEDCDIQWGASAGLDIEPNHDDHYVLNATFRRVTMGCHDFPWVVGGDAGDTGINHVTDIVIEDCVGLNAASSHTALLAHPHDGVNIAIRRHTDLRSRNIYCLDFSTWAGTVIVEDCNVTSTTSGSVTAGVKLGAVTAAVEIRNNVFNGASGAPGVGGADELYLITSGTPASITTCGNVWDMDSQNDGACP